LHERPRVGTAFVGRVQWHQVVDDFFGHIHVFSPVLGCSSAASLARARNTLTFAAVTDRPVTAAMSSYESACSARSRSTVLSTSGKAWTASNVRRNSS